MHLEVQLDRSLDVLGLDMRLDMRLDMHSDMQLDVLGLDMLIVSIVQASAPAPGPGRERAGESEQESKQANNALPKKPQSQKDHLKQSHGSDACSQEQQQVQAQQQQQQAQPQQQAQQQQAQQQQYTQRRSQQPALRIGSAWGTQYLSQYLSALQTGTDMRPTAALPSASASVQVRVAATHRGTHPLSPQQQQHAQLGAP